ncbi:MAG: hypothetical protein C0402_16805 [Thermodesulfovibrio sp.]|nr:hypothetical protein [Thermodesulfovibrio sp.]
MDVQKEIERLAYELRKRNESANSSDLDAWLEAERIVMEWMKDQEETENEKNAQKKQPDT